MGNTRLSEAAKVQIVELARKGLARNEIARQIGVSPSSVTLVCSKAGINFDRTLTEKMIEAKTRDEHLRRINFRSDLLDDIIETRLSLRSAKSPQDLMNLGKFFKDLIVSYERLAKLDPLDNRLEETKSLLGSLFEDMKRRAEEEGPMEFETFKGA